VGRPMSTSTCDCCEEPIVGIIAVLTATPLEVRNRGLCTKHLNESLDLLRQVKLKGK
jgi:hypothetical protein